MRIPDRSGASEPSEALRLLAELVDSWDLEFPPAEQFARNSEATVLLLADLNRLVGQARVLLRQAEKPRH